MSDPLAPAPADREGVGTGAGEGATGQDTGTAWVTRSTDCPEAPAQAHPLATADPDARDVEALLCQCHEAICPVHNEASDGRGEYDVDDLMRRFAAHDAEVRRTAAKETAERAWDEGFTRGFYDALAGKDRDASESDAVNPYAREEGRA